MKIFQILFFLFSSLGHNSFSQTVYTFNGNGNWTLQDNWENKIAPPAILPQGDTIIISPPAGSVCILNTVQVISQGAALIISANVIFIISNGVVINNNTTILPSVTICNQVWAQRNLDVITYRNGDTIPQVTDSAEWVNLTTGAWCYYNNDPVAGAVYGKLYNKYAIEDVRGLAPTGWHIPSNAEWDSLVKCLEPDTYCAWEESECATVGAHLKETGTIHWLSPNRGGSTAYEPEIDVTNITGFTALPGGCRADGVFSNIGVYGLWWTSTRLGEYPPGYWYAYGRRINHNQGQLHKQWNNQKSDGYSVRCVKD